MDTLETLRQRHYEARDALMAAESAEKDRRNSALVGKCFKARNSGSCPEGPQDYWPLYGRMLSAEDGQVIMFEFERDKDGMYRIEPRVRRCSIFSGFREITEGEFLAAWKEVLRELSALGEVLE